MPSTTGLSTWRPVIGGHRPWAWPASTANSYGNTASTEGWAYGAALLGMWGLDLIDSLELAVLTVSFIETVHPDAESASTYQRHRAVIDRLFDTLTPAFQVLSQFI